MTSEDDNRRWLLTVEPAILEAIGQLTVHFAHLEQEVAHFVASLIAGFDVVAAGTNAEEARAQFRAQKVGQAVTLKVGFRQKVEMLLSLSDVQLANAPAILDEVRAITKELRNAEEDRNRIVHSLWAGFHDIDGKAVPGVGVRIKPTRDAKIGMAQNISLYTTSELTALAESISRLAYRLSKLQRRCFAPEPDETG